MNILFVTEDHSIKNYGITTVVSQLADEITARNNGIKVIIAAMGQDSVQQDEKVTIELIPHARIGGFWGWSNHLINRLNNIITNYHIDIIHVHGIWMAAQWAALAIARKRNIPCIVSAHGMLEPWLWDKQGLLQKYKKKIYFTLVLKSVITKGTIFHAITPIEKDHLQQFFPMQKTVVIPNAIQLEKEYFPSALDDTRIPEKQIVFLGRIHPIKGVHLLINAFHKAELDREWSLVLAGPESVPEYTEKLRADVINMGISDRVKFTGAIYGEEKRKLFQNSWIMVIPSYTEVMGMVNLEASSCKVPSITTKETGLLDWEEGGGLLVHPDVDELTKCLKKVSRWSLTERLNHGNRSYELVANKYSWEAVMPKWEALYSSLFKGS